MRRFNRFINLLVLLLSFVVIYAFLFWLERINVFVVKENAFELF